MHETTPGKKNSHVTDAKILDRISNTFSSITDLRREAKCSLIHP